MAELISGLGGSAGYGEQSFKTSTVSGNLDDGFVSVNITSVFGAGGLTIGGTSYTNIFISSNGLITFQSGVTSYTPAALTTLNQPALAPFWTDADISKGGDICWDLDPATGRVIVTWLNAAPYQGTGTNSFQVVLTATGNGGFSVDYIYGQIGYTNGYAGQATAGFFDGTNQFLLEGSGDAAVLSTYASNDFDTNDPLGVYSLAFQNGVTIRNDGTVEGTSGNDLIDGAYTGDPEGDRIDANDATGFAGTTGNDDYVLAGAGNDTVNAGAGNDIVFGGYGNDVLNGGDGNDTLDGGSGHDNLSGGAGDDVLYGGTAAPGETYTPSYVEITTATQTVTGTSTRANFSVTTTSNENNLTTATNGTLSGFRVGNGDSNETHTHTASSQISGGRILFNGIDTTEQLSIRIDGTAINLNTAIANGTVTFNGGGLYGINAAGQIIRSSGTTSNPTGVGTLTINIPYTTLAVVATGTNTNNSSSGVVYEYYVNTQPLNLGAESGGNDTLAGGLGNDALFGGDGNDSLAGDDGNDTLTGGAGADTLNGGAGFDTADYSASTAAVTVNLSTGTGSGGDAAGDTLTGIEAVTGSAHADSLTGDGNANLLSGGAGNDLLSGGDGNDTLFGGEGDDTLIAGAGSDLIDGGDGNDWLEGGDGPDTLIGGNGDDSFSGLGIGDVVTGGDGQDTINLSNWGWQRTNIFYDPTNRANGTVQLLGTNGAVLGTLQFSGIETLIPCFTPGTTVTTRRGETPVEHLRPGDEVLTRDNGFRSLVWTGRRDLSPAELTANPRLRPIRIAAGALGPGLPCRDMLVSPQHRMLVEDARAELHFGEAEVLVPARHLTGRPGITTVCPPGIADIHIAFDGHEIVRADGTWSESFQPARPMLSNMQPGQIAELLALFPELAQRETAFPAARPTLKAHEARLLAA